MTNEVTLKFGENYTERRKFYSIKQQININGVDIEHIVVSNKYPMENALSISLVM